MKEIVVIGNAEIVEPFRATGAHVEIVHSPLESEEVLKKHIEEGTKLVFLEEVFFKHNIKLIMENREKLFPTIVPIPGRGAEGYAQERLRLLIRKAVGADIF